MGSVWDCAVCIRQMVGGPRCTEHNPTPEEREARRRDARVSRQTSEEEVYAF